jgi:hypothetical protein
MAVELNDDIKALLQEKDTIKAIASVDREGNPHVTYKDSLHINKDGNLEFYELIETSQTNKNFVSSIWFNHKVAINILGRDKRSYQIKGTPYKAIIAGREFQRHYDLVQEQFGDIDLSTVWVIEPEEVIEESFEKRRLEEEKAHPLLGHLDRWVVNKESEEN